MLTIIKLLLNKQTTLIYLILLFISFLIHFQHDYNKRILVLKELNIVTNKIHLLKTEIKNYFYLKEINEILIDENSKIKSINKTKQNHEIKYNDIRYIPGKVIYNSTNHRKNYILINKGSMHGIKKGMGVVSNKSVVGIVLETNTNYSKIMSILNSDFKISGKFKKNNYAGIIEWNGMDINKGNFNDFPIHAKINTGDTIVTSGYSLLFPENILLGKVHKIDEKNKILFSFHEEYNKIKYVYVIKSNDIEELQNMLK